MGGGPRRRAHRRPQRGVAPQAKPAAQASHAKLLSLARRFGRPHLTGRESSGSWRSSAPGRARPPWTMQTVSRPPLERHPCAGRWPAFCTSSAGVAWGGGGALQKAQRRTPSAAPAAGFAGRPARLFSGAQDHTSASPCAGCPLCMEDMDVTDKNFRPCKCGYQICLFCYNKIKDNHNGACPACRCALPLCSPSAALDAWQPMRRLRLAARMRPEGPAFWLRQPNARRSRASPLDR